uniref:Ig-like domain-containing protein n=1 Tax=Cyprinus carpio carpio TaxID=630221 RepID=A0A9J8B849_CYPCA
MEGESVTLNTDVNTIKKDDQIRWSFIHNNNKILIALINRQNNISTLHDDALDGRFRDRLKLDQTGSLIITNTRTTDSGLYTITGTSTEKPLDTFNLTVYARLSIPVISRDSPSSQQNCSLLCSVLNVSRVTLSWYKGNSLFSSISESDFSISLSLPLEVEYQDNNSYSCVVNNPIRNQTTHLDISQLCHTYSVSVPLIVLVSAAAGFLLIVAAVRIFCICRKTDQEVQSGEEITYADPTFFKRKAHKSSVQEQEDVVYAGVARH